VEDVRALRKKLWEINSVPFSEVEWFEDGKLLTISPERLEEWRFIGLTNTDFITTDFYKDYIEEEYTVREVYGDNEFVFINFKEVQFTIGAKGKNLAVMPQPGDRLRLYSVETSKLGETNLKKLGMYGEIIYEEEGMNKVPYRIEETQYVQGEDK
jgi:hypothetical protein